MSRPACRVRRGAGEPAQPSGVIWTVTNISDGPPEYAQRSDVAIVPTVAHPNVIFRESAPQRRVVGDPRAAPPLDPGVALALDHGVGLGVTTRMQVARDVTSRQADRAERAQSEMGEVLADSLASGPHV